jgi:hypothetical protein
MTAEDRQPLMSLTQRQKKLEMMITCPSGKGQVYIRNFIDPALRHKGPHLALRCKIREILGFKNNILELEEIVFTCCRNPMQSCEAYKRYIERNAAG